MITADGLDFLEEDGGVSAILKTVTVKFDADNIRSILEEGVLASGISQAQKKTLVQKIKSMSGETLKQILIQLSVDAMKRPDVLSQISSLVKNI